MIKARKSCQIPSEASADLILWGGNIITVDPQKPAAQAVAIKNGRLQ
jgi:predicted amidohydrolase YtcJ